MEQNRPKNYLIEAILVTIFCCQPFGIVSIVYAAQVNSRFAEGNYDGAKKASKSAKNWMIAAIISGFVLAILSVLLFIFVLGGITKLQ
ncbi:CD225/dispanin family protein [Lutibacter sp.]|uniref:CD225/dispanin family protein n=1 Tax=Lutibacter sp. TaxID=1925666 RepID=UPI001A28D73E|nr:CD225/dispanin family protein [Lutibacter sp.]MBI9041429.1 CD225/dispanin family protein [Lutibacter sp.]